MSNLKLAAAVALAALIVSSAAQAQAPAPLPIPGLPKMPPPPPGHPYGAPITQEQARVVVAAAEAEAARHNVHPTIAIVEPSGTLVYYFKATDSLYALEEMAMRKAKSAARNRRPTRYDMERYAAGQTAITAAEEIFPFAGGEPVMWQGKVIGAIGVTGTGAISLVGATGAGDEDEAVAHAGATALEGK